MNNITKGSYWFNTTERSTPMTGIDSTGICKIDKVTRTTVEVSYKSDGRYVKVNNKWSIKEF